MDFKKIILISLFILNFYPVMGQDHSSSASPLEEWLSEYRASEPVSPDGNKIIVPMLEEGVCIINGEIEVSAQDDRQVFLNALMFVVGNLDPLTDKIETVDFNNYEFRLSKKGINGIKGPELYNYIVIYKGEPGKLTLTAKDMKVENKGVISKKTPFEKLKPYSDYKHRHWMERQSLLFSNDVAAISDYMNSNYRDLIVSHYDDILAGNVVKGMTPEEVILTLGRPESIKPLGDREKWLYPSGLSVIFTDGQVSRVF